MTFPRLFKVLGVELSEVSVVEKLIATVGGGISILMLLAISGWVLPGANTTAVITSMGASAVLLFAVPHGQLSQPWPVIGGNVLSAFIGVTCSHIIPHPLVASACAVGLAIGAMHQLKCIHPPGGATAFTAVMGGSAVRDLGWWFILFPVLINAVLMVLFAIFINSVFKWRRYPSIFNQPSESVNDSPESPTHEAIVAALKSLDSFVDITEEDLVRLITILKPRS